MESEISNSTIVSMIEEKLPSSVKALWCVEVIDEDTTVDDRDKFPRLLKFLLKHKRAFEYGSNDLRSTKGINSSAEKVNNVTINEKAKNDDSHRLSDGKSSSNREDEKRSYTCWIHPNGTHDIENCKHFTNRTPDERMHLVNEYRACWCCLGIGHRKMNCSKYRECTVEGCKRAHHPLLHSEDHDKSVKQSHITSNSDTESSPSDTDSINNDEFKQNIASSNCNNQKGHCLLQLMKLVAGNGNGTINVMWDSGATVSMITFKKANELELNGTKTKITIVKVGGEKQVVDSRLYEVPIFDAVGKIEHFKAYGIQQISSPIDYVETYELAKRLQVAPDEVNRPDGEIDMLIGIDYAGFHPEKERAIEHLVLMKNKFGQCISGTHNSTTEKTQMIIQNVQVFHAAVKIDDFYSNESLGVSCQPKCGNCKCGECPIGGKQYTLQQERELAMINRGLELTDERWTARYPWKRSPEDLPNNYSQALAMLKSTERRLQKNPEHADMYAAQIDDMIERKVARKLSKREIQEHSGPVFYVSHHEVMKPDSESTPCRIVFNSSLKYNNHMLNDYWVKGPDLVNNLLGVLIRFRENLVGVAGDVRKMYHSVKISELDQHTHRFLWREMRNDRKPDEYVITAVSFGDKPAGAIASLALRKTAELNADQYPEAAKTITNNSYVDDILNSFNTTEIARNITSDIDTVLDTGGFQIKRWIMSKDTNIGVMEVCSEADAEYSKVLGVVWNPSTDTFQFVIKLNFSKKHRKIREGADLTAADLPAQIPQVLTKRAILSQVNGIYDPLGLATPFTVKAKMIMRRLNAVGLGWDDPVPDNERAEWAKFFSDLFKMEKITFARSTRPSNAIGQPILIMFSDASEDAFGACAYVRWEMSNGSFESTLLVAKSRLAPMKKITIPRLELNGALLAARLRDFVSRETNMSFSKTYCIIDSEIVRAMIQKESYGFNTFVGVRIGEIQATTEKDDWYWIESAKNIADIISRGSDPSDLDENSEWQKGPKFLKDREEDWPIRNSYSGVELPEQIIATAIAQIETTPSIGLLIDIERFSSYSALIPVTARVQSVFTGTHSLRNIVQVPCRESMDKAERVWILDAQKTVKVAVKPQTLKRLSVTEIDGLMVVGTRIESWEEHTYNRKNPILLHAECQLAKLYAQHVHDTCHLGISSVAVKVRSKYWIVGLRSLLKSIQYKCVTCRKLKCEVQQQIMGHVPNERLSPAPAWSYTSVDLFGPYSIKGETNKRSRGRGYGVIFNCMLTRAVYLDLATDYSTDGFILVLRRFISIRGCPLKMWSDRGSQLKAADKEVRQIIAGLDEKAIIEFGSSKAFDWTFTTPNAPWQNACSESLIKSVKKVLKFVIGDQILSFSEMLTVLFETADMVNSRPIGRHPTSLEDGAYLSPNDVLLGRSTKEIPNTSFDTSSNLCVRQRFCQKIVNAFWKKWTRDFFPSLIIRQKWHTSQRNIRVGDIVIMQDANALRGKWKLGKVSRADPSLRDGFVRNIEIQHGNTTVQRLVQKVVVLVPVDEQ